MDRQKLIGRLALAFVIVLVAAIAGHIRRWDGGHRAEVEEAHVVLEEFPPQVEDVAPHGWPHADEPEVLVRFRPGITREMVSEITSVFNDRVEDEIEAVGGLVAVNDLDDAEVERILNDYGSLPVVEYVEVNEVISLRPPAVEPFTGDGSYAPSPVSGAPNDPLFNEQWALVNTGQREGKSLADVDALAAWAKTRGDGKVVVAVLDSGVDYTHPDLVNNTWLRPENVAPYSDRHLGEMNDLRGYDATTGRDPMDENGHGTHCAGIIGAEGNNREGIAGVNWQVKIMPLKFMGRGGFGTTRAAIEAINYVIDRKKAGVNVRIISASWGSQSRSRALEDVIRKAGEEGILFVAAAGNNGEDADRRPHYPSGYDLPNVLSVAALNRRDELASFSNYGQKRVHLAAPGAEILSTWLNGTYEEHSGTSMATPVVSGVAALILSAEPNLSVKELKQRLLDSVDKLDSLQGKVVSGGRINAARAVGASTGR